MLLEKDLSLPSYVAEYTEEIDITLDSVQKAIAKLLDLNYSEETCISRYQFGEKIDTAKEKLICQYISQQLSLKFPLLNKKLFELKRFIKAKAIDGDIVLEEDYLEDPLVKKRSENKIPIRHIEIPLLVNCNLTESETGLGWFPVPGRSKEQFYLRTKLPATMPSEAIDLQVEACKIINSAIADLLNVPIIAKEIINRQIKYYYDIAFKIYWIPKLKDISVKDIRPIPDDPILVMIVNGDRFLIDEWDEPEESPLKAILEEFNL